MNTSHEVPSRPISNRKYHAPGPQKSEGTGEVTRDCFLRHIKTLARSFFINSMIEFGRETFFTKG